jgi:4-amino-4-deoxy-L-arabinose transferase-like glycosyltransferase
VLPVTLAQSIVGAGTVVCAGLLAADLFGERAAILAAAATALYPYYVVHDTALQETGLFTLLTLVSVILLLRASRTGSLATAGAAGFVLAADVLTRATILPFAAFAPIWLVASGPRTRRSWWAAAACTGALAALVSPWLLRSYSLFGSPVLVTETGMQLWRGNNRHAFEHYPVESMDVDAAAAVQDLTAADRLEIESLSPNEAIVDRWFFRKGVEFIASRPVTAARNGARKVLAAFSWIPSPRGSGWRTAAHALSYGPVMVLGISGMIRSRHAWRTHGLVYMLFLSFGAVTAVFYAHTSHRVFLDVYWIVYAAWFVDERLSVGGRQTAPSASKSGTEAR